MLLSIHVHLLVQVAKSTRIVQESGLLGQIVLKVEQLILNIVRDGVDVKIRLDLCCQGLPFYLFAGANSVHRRVNIAASRC